MRWSIRYQLLVPILTLLLGVVGLSVWVAAASVQRARGQIETQVRNVAHTLSDSSFPLSARVLDQMKGLSGAEFLLIDADGQRIATLPAERIELPPAEVVDDDWQSLHLGPPVTIGDATYLFSGVRLRHRHVPGATLYILYPESLWRDAFWEAIWPGLMLGLCGGSAAVALALGVAQRLGRRVQELERRTRLIAAGDFSPMPLPPRNDELRDLSRSVNDMAQQLAQLQETIRKTERLRLHGQTSGGLAHQLRNGVAGARLALQLHAQECLGDREPLDVAQRQLTLLETHLKRFLDLGRTEPMRAEPCSLAHLVEQNVELLRPKCRHIHTDLVWQRPKQEPTIRGDAGQLGQVILNLLTNAVEAAGPQGTVEVRVRRAAAAITNGKPDASWAVVEVLDTGPGPPPELVDKLFEPFVTGKRDGVGLGLAVARQVAEAHGGRIGWSREDGRTCFRLELPLPE